MRGRTKLIGATSAAIVVIAGIVASAVYLLNSHSALAGRGPDGDYGNATVYYFLGDEGTIKTKSVLIPVYVGSTPPASNVDVAIYFSQQARYNGKVEIRYNCSGGTDCQAAGYDNKTHDNTSPGAPDTENITLKKGLFTSDSLNGPTHIKYYQYISVTLLSGNPSSVAFKVTAPGAVVRYTADNDAHHFAIANINRCTNGDEAACGNYYDYTLDFAPPCTRNSAGTSYVNIYDPDDPSPPGNDGNTSTQTDVFFTTEIFDRGTDPNDLDPMNAAHAVWSNRDATDGGTPSKPYDKVGGTPQPQSYWAPDQNDVWLQFNWQPQHKYTMVLKNVYSNNVLQLQMPWNSVNAGIDCNNLPNGSNDITLNSSTPTVSLSGAPGVASFKVKVTSDVDAGFPDGLIPDRNISGNNNVPAYFSNGPPGGAVSGSGSYNGAAKAYEWDDSGGRGALLESYSFNVAANTPTGPYRFNACVGPGSFALKVTGGVSQSGQSCDDVIIQVINAKSPTLSVGAGDIHVGCGTSTSSVPGTIQTNIGSSALELVTAAGGTINALTSAQGTTALDITGYTPGPTLAFGALCLPKLLDIATSYQSNNPGAYNAATNPKGITTLGAGTYDLGSATFSHDGVYQITGAATTTLKSSGIIKHNITVWVLGNAAVTPPIKIDTSGLYARANLPGLGVIVGSLSAGSLKPGTGNITINPTANGASDEADGYWWAGGTLHTCDGTVAAPDAKCNSTLTVNGFLMGHSVLLERWGVGANGAQTAENVNLVGQLYLNPPVIFDTDSFDNGLANGQNERPPLY